MKIKIMNLFIAALLAFSALMAASPVSAHGRVADLKGLISAVDTGAGTLTVTPKGGGPDVTFNVDSSTLITRLHHSASLADLQPGDRVKVWYNPSTLLASRIQADLNLVSVEGAISGVDTGAGTVSITPRGGSTDVVLNVDSTTVIKRSGATAGLADLKVSDRVTAKYYPTTLLAASISAWPNLVTLKGTISGVDTGAGTLTVTPKGGGTDVVLNVDLTTVIKRSGATASLADLQVSDRVEATYNPVTLLAASVNAWPYLATLKGTISGVDTGAGTLTVTPKGGGTNVVLNVDSTTVIKRSGATASLADLKVGDLVEAKYNPVTLLAANISAWPKIVWLWGTISAVDTGAGTLTVTPKNGGADVVLTVDSHTYIRRGHHSATLADLQVGDHVLASYDQGSLLALWLIVGY